MQRTTEKKEKASDSFFRRKSLCTLLPCPGLTGLTALPRSVPAGVSLQKSQRLGETSMCGSPDESSRRQAVHSSHHLCCWWLLAR